MAPLTVACVLRSGGIYNPWHVERLTRHVEGSRLGAQVVCLTDLPASEFSGDIGIEPLVHDWPGWWSKIELFRPAWSGSVIYLDLDVVVRGDLSVLARERFTATPDFLQPNRINSSVMSWASTPRHLYETFRADPDGHMARYRRWPSIGDQAFIEAHAEPERYAPGLVASFKVDCKERVPDGAVVVAFHGKPKPWECGRAWAE